MIAPASGEWVNKTGVDKGLLTFVRLDCSMPMLMLMLHVDIDCMLLPLINLFVFLFFFSGQMNKDFKQEQRDLGP